jgi:hypothetical protein
MTLTLSQPENFQLAVYGLDWDKYNGRDTTITVGTASERLDAATGYQTGAYAVFDVNAAAGPLTITMTQNAGNASNATISGIFFDKISTPEPASLVVWGLAIAGGLVIARRRRRA